MLNVACSGANPWSLRLNTASFAQRGEFFDYFGVCISYLQANFCTCSKKKDLQKPICEPPACSIASICNQVSKTINVVVKMLLEVSPSKSRLLHGGYSTKNISSCSTEVQRETSQWERSYITGQLNINFCNC